MAWVFRSLRVVVVALLPNVVPLFFIAGLMGALGIDLKVSTAIIFSNAFGIAVDDTIHLLAKLRIELSRGLSLPYALKRTYLSGGKAVIVMSLMLLRRLHHPDRLGLRQCILHGPADQHHARRRAAGRAVPAAGAGDAG